MLQDNNLAQDYHQINQTLKENKAPVFFATYEDSLETSLRQNFPWHLKFTVSSNFSPFKLESFREEMDIQAQIEEYLSLNITRSTNIKKAFAIFDDNGNIEYHWYLQDAMINLNFEEIQSIRKVEVALARDENWQNNADLLVFLEKPNHDEALNTIEDKFQLRSIN
ncbi:hypothetical protein [Croceivirga radicis]|uniref:Uncharacterized protein n=1 Tax=Croceivirga radicis TaxID=1929488 RepID=A0A1V6LNQ4_9FLAO|nr:hypothetical protein [Croceivirga radicis]OQD41657.1 hypothetical protein BUL40_14900 [Croceivirga radicis]